MNIQREFSNTQEFQEIPKEECGYCGNGTDPDDICDDCWKKMHEETI